MLLLAWYHFSFGKKGGQLLRMHVSSEIQGSSHPGLTKIRSLSDPTRSTAEADGGVGKSVRVGIGCTSVHISAFTSCVTSDRLRNLGMLHLLYF